MKNFVYAVDSLKHIECSIVAFNGICPIKHFDTDESFLQAWKASQLKKKKFDTINAFNKLDSDQFSSILKKLRANSSMKSGENKAYGFFFSNYGISKEEIKTKLGIKD